MINIGNNIKLLKSGNKSTDNALKIILSDLTVTESILFVPLWDYEKAVIIKKVNEIFSTDAFPLFIHFDSYECNTSVDFKMAHDLLPGCHLNSQGYIVQEIKNKIRCFKLRDRQKFDTAKRILEAFQKKFKFGTIGNAYIEINNRIYNDEKRRQYELHYLMLKHYLSSEEGLNDLFFKADYKTTNTSSLEQAMLQQDYADCMRGLISNKRWHNSLDILLIDNQPEPFKKPFKWLSDLFEYNVSIIKNEDIKYFFGQIEKKNSGQIYDLQLTTYSLKDDTPTSIPSLDKFGLILLDLHLGDDELCGQTILKELIISNPEIPVFILSSIEDSVTIIETLQKGADYYVPKSRLLSLPGRINNYFQELGELLNHIQNAELRKNIIGNLRKWRFTQKVLWFGDKCYHMIDHSYNHALNDWNIANQLLPPILDKLKENNKISDVNIYSFCMAIWLHDIGHKGNERYGEPHEIRDLHGLISAELILKHPEHYGIFGFGAKDSSPYRWLTFRPPQTSLQTIRDRITSLVAAGKVMELNNKKVIELYNNLTPLPGPIHCEESFNDSIIKKLTILERITLLCLYHKSNFPIDEDDIQNLKKEGKRIPTDCYENYDRQAEPIHLKNFSNLMGDSELLPLMALFRFIDGLDCNKNRVGDITEEGIKKETIRRDLSYQLYKLQLEVHLLAVTYLKSLGKEKRFINLFYEQVKNEIEKQQWISKDLKKEQRAFLDSLEGDIPLDNYEMLTEYIEFISVQDGHFDLHNSIEKIEIIEIKENKIQKFNETADKRLRFSISYHSQKESHYLETREVKLRGQKKGRNIPDHLLGPKEKDEKGKEIIKENGVGYVRKELNNGKNYLNGWIDLDNTEIILIGKDKEFHEPQTKSH